MKKYYSLFVVLLLTFSFSVCLGREQHKTVWVENGKASIVIVTAENPFPVATYAAKELAYHIKKATGVEISVKEESEKISSSLHKIYIGQSNAARKAGIDHLKLESEQCVIRSAGDNLFIVGNDGEGDPLDFKNDNSGTLWGVYEILDQELGIRWLWPGELGTYVPSSDKIEMGSWNKTIKPAMVMRQVRTQTSPWKDGAGTLPNGYSSREAYERYVKEEQIFQRRHRMGYSKNRVPTAGHSFGGWWKKYGKQHPEWFQKLPEGELANKWREDYSPFWPIDSIPDGGWKNHRGPGEDFGTSMCVSNKEFQKEIVNNWEKQRIKNPDKKNIIGLGENDIKALCTCEACRALDAPQLTAEEVKRLPAFIQDQYIPMNAGRRYAIFWKQVYERAAKIDTNVQVTAFVYLNFFVAPDDVKLHKNIILGFVPWGGWWFPRDPREQQWLYSQWQKWRATGATLYFRPNTLYNGGSMPHVYAHELGEDFKFVMEHGCVGTDWDGFNGQWAVNGTTSYLLFRLHNHPDESVSNILDEYYMAFGPAALQVKAYFDYWETHAVYNRAISDFGGSTYIYNRFASKLFPPECFVPAKEILDKAKQVVANEEDKQYARRIDFLVKGLEHAEKEAKLSALFSNSETSEEELHNALLDLVNFRQKTEKLNIANFLISADKDRAAWKDHFSLESNK